MTKTHEVASQKYEFVQGGRKLNKEGPIPDMSTVHEAYQFLVKTFVETDEGWKAGIIIDDSITKREEKRENLSRRESMTSLMSIENDRQFRYLRIW